VVRASILSSLFSAVNDVGEGPELAFSLADIFAWDIDFIRDIREGDSFKVLVEKRFREGAFSGYGPILAAEFDNNDEIYKAYRFEAKDGRADYYDEEGKSVRKAFLKAPLKFSRISSGFTNRRFHPILKRYKPHRAIDYAAPTGTPIHSVGSGVVTRKGYTKYNGRYVRIRHNSIYQTHYNHMSRFAKGIKVGARVDQGQTIGYVGATGLATGPHLDFRMYKNGVAVNPLKVKTPSAAPVPKALLTEFNKAKAAYAAQFKDSLPIHISALEPKEQ
jgi:murein DD-endopeptidase MepM/ murein hydrolase activator NlpD